MLVFQDQIYVIFQSFLFGCFLAFLFEFHSAFAFLFGLRDTGVKRIRRLLQASNKNSRVRKLVAAIWDFYYFVSIAPLCAIFLFGVNNGIIRWYIVLTALLGFLLFRLTFGRIINSFLDITTYYVKRCIYVLLAKLIKATKLKFKQKRRGKKKNKRTILLYNGKQG